MLGCNLYQERKGEYCFLYTMCIYLRQTKEAMMSMREEDDPLSYAEACHFMALLCVYNHNGILGKEYFMKAMRVVDTYDIRFAPRFESNNAVSSPHSSSGEQLLARVALLCQLIYFQLHSTLIIGETEDLCYDLRLQFMKELPVHILSSPPPRFL
jgi:hypothetical protein